MRGDQHWENLSDLPITAISYPWHCLASAATYLELWRCLSKQNNNNQVLGMTAMSVLLHPEVREVIVLKNPRNPLLLPVPRRRFPAYIHHSFLSPRLPLWSGRHAAAWLAFWHTHSVHWYFKQLIKNIYTPKTFGEGHIQSPCWSRWIFRNSLSGSNLENYVFIAKLLDIRVMRLTFLDLFIGSL